MRPVALSGVCVNQWSGGYNVSTMKSYLALLSVVILHCCAAQSPPGALSMKGRLLEGLLSQYEKDVEPPEGNTTVWFGLTLHCVAPSHDYSLFNVEAWTQIMWTDSRLTWDPAQFDGVSALRINPSRIWKPDIRLYNAMNTKVADVLALVFYDGNAMWIPPVTYETRCEHLEDSRVNCTLMFGSWAYDGYILDIQAIERGDALSLEDYQSACPMVVKSHAFARREKYYECCPEPYPSININLMLAYPDAGK